VIGHTARVTLSAAAMPLLVSLAAPVEAGGTLRIAMTASDVPTTTGAPDNGFEGLRFLGYPVYEGGSDARR
jgi:peptide/nickel transport system substrate-binding protein